MTPRSILRHLISLVPYHPWLYHAADTYISSTSNLYDHRIAKNGELRLLRSISPELRVVIDGGANVGEWAKLVLRHAPGAEIHCFEPVSTSFALLTAVDFPRNVVRIKKGLHCVTSSAEAYVYADGGESNSLFSQFAKPEGTTCKEMVSLLSLDDYWIGRGENRPIDFVKLDSSRCSRSCRGGLYMSRITMSLPKIFGCEIT